MSRRRFISQLCNWIAALAIVVSLGGCGGSDRPKTIPISGLVTINGQPPGETGKMYFAPTKVADGYSKRPATGTFFPDGSYRVMSWELDDGLVPGRYIVRLYPTNPEKTSIPERFRKADSGLEVEVSVDEGEVEYNIDLVGK